jgi:integral membrane protein
MNLSSKLATLRLLSLLEGISYIAFAITMPLKYAFNIFWPNMIMGYTHGFLFIAYCVFVLLVGIKYKWSTKIITISGIASLIPFATFWADRKIFEPQQRHAS